MLVLADWLLDNRGCVYHGGENERWFERRFQFSCEASGAGRFLTPDALLAGGTGVRGFESTQDRPKYVTKPEEQLTESFYGRISNENMDVVHFSMAVVLSTEAIVPFMRELCGAKGHSLRGFTGKETAKVFKHNQITILECRVKPVALLSTDYQYYRYGAESVAEVEMVCEYIFNKQGYNAIKPELIKGPAAANRALKRHLIEFAGTELRRIWASENIRISEL